MNDVGEITPDDSVVPVFLDDSPLPPDVGDTSIADNLAARDAAVAKLVALGLTEDEARAIAGM